MYVFYSLVWRHNIELCFGGCWWPTTFVNMSNHLTDSCKTLIDIQFCVYKLVSLRKLMCDKKKHCYGANQRKRTSTIKEDGLVDGAVISLQRPHTTVNLKTQGHMCKRNSNEPCPALAIHSRLMYSYHTLTAFCIVSTLNWFAYGGKRNGKIYMSDARSRLDAFHTASDTDDSKEKAPTEQMKWKKVVTPFRRKKNTVYVTWTSRQHVCFLSWVKWKVVLVDSHTHTNTHTQHTPLLKLAQDPVGPTLPPLPLLPSLPGKLLSSGPDKMLSAAL